MTKRTDNPSAEVRIRVMKRDRFQCTYCGASGNDTELEVDHIIAVANGGSNHMSNLTTACVACNRSKSDKKDHKAPTRKFNGLDGMYLHTFGEKGIKYQGQVLSTDGEFVLVQLFSWLSGNPTIVEKLPRELVYSDACKLYADHETWVENGDLESRKHWGGDNLARFINVPS